MLTATDRAQLAAIDDVSWPLTGSERDFDRIVRAAQHSPIVAIGEASHGTHDFHRVRAELTKRLIRELGFNAVAVEGDWPAAYRINRYVRGRGGDTDAAQALGGFVRFPQWMWRNADVLDFVGWLRAHNETQSSERGHVGFYGLDLYSLHESMHAVIDYLRIVDPEGARRAEARYACFDRFGSDARRYGHEAVLGVSASCENEVIGQLVELRSTAAAYARRDGRVGADDLYFAEESARVVASAERYYRTMFRSGVASWNLRDRHMLDTLVGVLRFVRQMNGAAKVVVWAHNSHVGDAAATELGARGEITLGHLLRSRLDASAPLVGFTTYDGTVTAASGWDEPAERKAVRPALDASYEALFHEAAHGNVGLELGLPAAAPLHESPPRLERAIGVIYLPRTERVSHYFAAQITRQFDFVLHYDHTRAVEPLERTALWERGEAEVPETYPSAL